MGTREFVVSVERDAVAARTADRPFLRSDLYHLKQYEIMKRIGRTALAVGSIVGSLVADELRARSTQGASVPSRERSRVYARPTHLPYVAGRSPLPVEEGSLRATLLTDDTDADRPLNREAMPAALARTTATDEGGCSVVLEAVLPREAKLLPGCVRYVDGTLVYDEVRRDDRTGEPAERRHSSSRPAADGGTVRSARPEPDRSIDRSVTASRSELETAETGDLRYHYVFDRWTGIPEAATPTAVVARWVSERRTPMAFRSRTE